MKQPSKAAIAAGNAAAARVIHDSDKSQKRVIHPSKYSTPRWCASQWARACVSTFQLNSTAGIVGDWTRDEAILGRPTVAELESLLVKHKILPGKANLTDDEHARARAYLRLQQNQNAASSPSNGRATQPDALNFALWERLVHEQRLFQDVACGRQLPCLAHFCDLLWTSPERIGRLASRLHPQDVDTLTLEALLQFAEETVGNLAKFSENSYAVFDASPEQRALGGFAREAQILSPQWLARGELMRQLPRVVAASSRRTSRVSWKERKSVSFAVDFLPVLTEICLTSSGRQMATARSERIFNAFDSKGDGVVVADDLKKALSCLSPDFPVEEVKYIQSVACKRQALRGVVKRKASQQRTGAKLFGTAR